MKRKNILLIMILLCSFLLANMKITGSAAEVTTFTKDKFIYTITKQATLDAMGTVSVSINDLYKNTVKSVEIPQKVIYNNLVYLINEIDKTAFYNCTNLVSVTIPSSVVNIDTLAFGKCTNLKNVSVPNSVISIGTNSFYGCSSKLVITCVNNSKAYTYAVENEIKYKKVSQANLNNVSNKLIIVGDSRTYNMSTWVNASSSIQFVAESGQGYNWFVTQAIHSVDLVKNPGDTVLIWLGVNDYFSTELGVDSWTIYANRINTLAQTKWADCKVYVGSVGYVDSAKILAYYGEMNRSNATVLPGTNGLNGIEDYNARLKTSLIPKVNWIDMTSVIGIRNNDTDITPDDLWVTRNNGMKDGLHYSQSKTLEIYNYFLKATGFQ